MEMTPQPNPAVRLFSDIKKIALITFIATVLGLLIPVWRLTQQVAATRLPVWARVSFILFGYLFSAIMPLFYFALYRNEGTLRFPIHLRRLSLITALLFGAISMLDWKRVGSASIVAIARDPRMIDQIAILLGECSNLAYILLLLAFFRQADGSFTPTDVPVSRLLSFVTKAALTLWGIWVAFNLVRVVVAPFAYAVAVSKAGRTPLPLSGMMLEVIQMLLTQACLFIAPYVVYNSWLRRDETPGEMLPSLLERLPS
jgi:hypothetical protein